MPVSQADVRALTIASLSTDLTATMNAVVTRCAPKITMARVRLRVPTIGREMSARSRNFRTQAISGGDAVTQAVNKKGARRAL